jgi:hypothetical protein
LIKQYYKDNSIADFNFILQYKAIPENVRREFYYRLKWKSSGKSAKRIKLIEILERYISQKIKPKWDKEAIARKIGISKESYFCLKCRLLQSLREYYFNWKEIEKKLVSKNKTTGLDLTMIKVRKMIELGMMRRVKNTLFKVETKILAEGKIDANNIVLLSEVYEHLIIYYHRQRNKLRFNIIYKNLKKLSKYKVLLNKEQKAFLEIRTSIANAFSEIFLVRSDRSTELALQNYLFASKLAKKLDDKYYLKMLFYAGNIYHETGRIAQAEKTFTIGYNFASEKNLKNAKNVFHTKLMLLSFLKDNSKAKEYAVTAEKYYNYAITHPTDVDYTMHILFHYLRFVSFEGYGEKFKYLSEELVDRLFLYLRKADAVIRWYALEADKYIDDLRYWYEENGYVKMKVDEYVLQAFENFNYGALLKFGKFYSYDQLAFVYITQVEIEFWKGRKCNFENANYYLDKLQRIGKKISSYSNTDMPELLRVCLKILEENIYKKSEDVFMKYLPDLKLLFNSLQSKEKNYNLSNEYSFLYCTAEILNVDEFKSMVKSFEKWIRVNKPGIFEELLKDNMKKAV